ncbi:hypothetical protein CDD81_2526 [Ophiocordyceps australis]|uniref:INO80 complex subunit B-like conserved region domain-containing protein n=1 Tax=Ophiocordyceps australis TaxID=1399860 RepID=A0A2C5YDQ6_9HYPO|nr:hypothetical protein CDD81_2526 [Ophiocordyceps australis]
MSSRPRRSAAQRANTSISVHAKWADATDKSDRMLMASRRSGRNSAASVMRDMPSSPSDSHISVSVRPTASSAKARQAARASTRRRSDAFQGTEAVNGTRNRGGRKNYVVDSSPDDDEDDDEEMEDGDDDVEADDMDLDPTENDLDAEGDEDAEGEDVEGDMDLDLPATATAPTIRVSQASSRAAARVAASRIAAEHDDDDDDLSDPGESDAGENTLGFADETMADEEGDQDAEGEEIEVAGEDDEEGVEAAGGAADSDEDGSRAGTPDLTKMTKRQRARFEDEPQEYMKLSDEVQVKKHFTAEELSMRRQEMARRRRNLSEKRNEEVKMETINKLLKKQAPKMNRKAAANAGRATTPEDDENKPSPLFVRWVSRKDGNRVCVPEEIVAGPAGKVFEQTQDTAVRKTVQEAA